VVYLRLQLSGELLHLVINILRHAIDAVRQVGRPVCRVHPQARAATQNRTYSSAQMADRGLYPLRRSRSEQ